MNILVTGGAGFIGSHLVDRLLGRGERVVVLDDLNDYYDPEVKKRNLQQAGNSSSMTFVEGDVRDAALLDKVFSDNGFDVVVHLAARAGVRPSLEQPVLYEDVNCRGTLRLLECCRKQKVPHFVFASSSSVYGNVKETPFREDARINRPVSPYAATKAAGELYCYNYHHLYDLSVNVLRFFTVYGPRGRPDMAIYKFTSLIEKGEPLPFYGDGTTARDYTFFRDIIDGVEAAVDRRFGFGIFNLGESRTTTLRELVEIIEAKLGKKAKLNRLPLQPGDVTITCADVTRAEKLLDYRPSTTVSEGVERFVAWYRKVCC